KRSKPCFIPFFKMDVELFMRTYIATKMRLSSGVASQKILVTYPRTVGVVDEQAIAKRVQLPACSKQSFGCGALHVGFRLRVNGLTKKIVFGGLSNIEMNRRIERREIDQVGLEKVARFMRRLGRESLLGQVSERFLRAGMKDAALDRTEETALKNDAANFN